MACYAEYGRMFSVIIMKKIAIGISGGVDSAAAAYLLKKQGNEVFGITLRLNSGEKELSDARLVAEALGIEHRILDLRDFFKNNIIEPFAAEYVSGRTPNPCIECNRLIKFGAMLDYALENGCDALATGHYASTVCENGKYFLKKANSPKDQSYFLFRLDQNRLSKIIFPLAETDKSEIRELAAKAGIPVADKHDSQEICFVPDNDYPAYLASLGITSPKGDIIDKDGNVLGTHSGIINYTIGQRKGLGAFGKPMFVTSLNAANNTVTVGENGSQYSGGLVADRASWINEIPREPFRADVKIRFRAKEAPALIIPDGENGFSVKFDEPRRSVTPGQSAVIYDGDTVLGGGRIISQVE